MSQHTYRGFNYSIQVTDEGIVRLHMGFGVAWTDTEAEAHAKAKAWADEQASYAFDASWYQ